MTDEKPRRRSPPGVPKIDAPQVPEAMMLALRRVGVTVPEVVSTFRVDKMVARRFLLRLVKRGYLYRALTRRRRVEVYGEHTPGAPAVVYRATPVGRLVWGSHPMSLGRSR